MQIVVKISSFYRFFDYILPIGYKQNEKPDLDTLDIIKNKILKLSLVI